jgi:Phospholipase_D-nuclease N-terminal
MMELLGWIVVLLAGLVWITLLALAFADVFGRDELSGWAKAGWVGLMLVFPLVGVLSYLVANGAELGHRRQRGPG